jgi:fatty acid desaturase
MQRIDRKQILQDLRINLRKESLVSSYRSTLAILWTLVITVAVLNIAVDALELKNFILSCVSFVAIAALQHRISIIHHEGIHKLLFRNKWFNDFVGLFIFGASLGILPNVSRHAHLLHHKFLGTEKDQERDPYISAPKTAAQFLKWCILKLTAIDGILRVVKLANTPFALAAGTTPPLSFQRGNASQRPFPFCDLLVIGINQTVLLALFQLTVGSLYYFLLWLLPLFTISRLLVAIRSISEHWSKEGEFDPEVKYLNSIYCNKVERFLFGPYYFNYHAEHHLFPSIPSWKLASLSQKVKQHPEFRRSVSEHKSYIFFIAGYFGSPQSN